MNALAALQMLLLAALGFALLAGVGCSLLVGPAMRWTMEWAPARRHRALLIVATAPFALACSAVVSVMLPSVLGLYFAGHDHCHEHGGHSHLRATRVVRKLSKYASRDGERDAWIVPSAAKFVGRRRDRPGADARCAASRDRIAAGAIERVGGTMRRSARSARRFVKPTDYRFLGLLLGLCGVTRVHGQPLQEIEGAARVCEAGPGANLARAQRLAGAVPAIAAGVLPNPSLVLEHRREFSGPTDRETVAGVSVPLPIGGRRGLLRDAASERRAQAEAEADGTLFESALAFRRAYVRAVLDRARVEVLAGQQALLEQLSTTIAGLAKGGEAAGYDLLRQRLEAQLHRRTLELAQAQARASLELLGAWLDGEVQLADVPPLELSGGSAPAPMSAHATHPELRQLEAETRASALEIRAAERLWIPQPTLFAGYRGTESGGAPGHGIELSVEVPIAVFDHGQAEAARARAEQARASAAAQSLRRTRAARLRASNEQLELLKASAARAQSTSADADTLLDKARQLYGAGEATITELLEAFSQAEAARLASIDLAEEMAMTRLARMEAAGTQHDARLDQLCGGAPRSKR